MRLPFGNTKSSVDKIIPADTVWAAAAAAYRINGGYLKDRKWQEVNGSVVLDKEANKTVVSTILRDGMDLTKEDYELGKAARNYHVKNVMFRTLRGRNNGWDETLGIAAKADEFALTYDSYWLAVIASQISSYIALTEKDEAEGRIDPTAPVIGNIGDKVELDIEIISAIYSKNYNVYFHNAITSLNQLVIFSYRDRLLVKSKHHVKGTVKANTPNNRINRVKIIDTKIAKQ